MRYNGHVNAYKIRQFRCAGCGKEVRKRARPAQRYCTLDCYRESDRPQRRTGRVISCKRCGKEVYVPSYRVSVAGYCSHDCWNKAQSRKVILKCSVCGENFSRSPSWLVGHSAAHRYCSMGCRNRCEVWKRDSTTAANLKQCRNKKPNRLEIAGNIILKDLGFGFSTQTLICDKFVVDAFIPEANLVIQWDGDYWHGFNGAKDARQKKRMSLDKSQDAYMRKSGLRVLRFWEHEVYEEPEKVSENIRRTVQSVARAS